MNVTKPRAQMLADEEWEAAYAQGWADALVETARVTKEAIDAAMQTADEGFSELRTPGVVLP